MLFFLACTSKPQAPSIKVNFTNGNRSVSFKGFDQAVMNDMDRDSADWKTVFPVYKMPADTDDKDYQKPQPGKYLYKDGSVIFTPDTPFIKGHAYFTRILNYEEGHSMGSMIRNKNLLASKTYIELIFKY